MRRTNALVITDVSSNIRRIVTILQVADEGERFPLKILIYPLAFADANGVAQALTNIFRQDGDRDERQSDSGATRMTAEEAKAAAEQMKADGNRLRSP